MIPSKENARFLRVLNMRIHTLITKLDACKFLFLLDLRITWLPSENAPDNRNQDPNPLREKVTPLPIDAILIQVMSSEILAHPSPNINWWRLGKTSAVYWIAVSVWGCMPQNWLWNFWNWPRKFLQKTKKIKGNYDLKCSFDQIWRQHQANLTESKNPPESGQKSLRGITVEKRHVPYPIQMVSMGITIVVNCTMCTNFFFHDCRIEDF